MKTLSSKIIILILVNMVISFSANAIIDALRVKVSDGVYSDSTVINFSPNLTNGFDLYRDAHKNWNANTLVPEIFTTIYPSQWHLKINGLPSLISEVKVDLSIKVNTSGIYSIHAFELGAFLPGVSITLEDKMTGIVYPFRNGKSYNINLFANTIATSNRFVLHFAAPTHVVFSDITCFGSADGTVSVTKAGDFYWSYQLMGNSGTIIQAGGSTNESITLFGLSPGIYYIVTSSFYTLPDTTSFVISSVPEIISDFELDNGGVLISQTVPVEFENNSSGASSFIWDFGDGSPLSTEVSPIHQYSSAGSYTISLTASNLSCDVTFSKTIQVYQIISTFEVAKHEHNYNGGFRGNSTTLNSSHTTNIASDLQEQNVFSVFQQNGMLVIDSQTPVPSQITIRVFNTIGQTVYSEIFENSTNASKAVFLPASGNYFVNVFFNNEGICKKVNFIKS